MCDKDEWPVIIDTKSKTHVSSNLTITYRRRLTSHRNSKDAHIKVLNTDSVFENSSFGTRFEPTTFPTLARSSQCFHWQPTKVNDWLVLSRGHDTGRSRPCFSFSFLNYLDKLDEMDPWLPMKPKPAFETGSSRSSWDTDFFSLLF